MQSMMNLVTTAATTATTAPSNLAKAEQLKCPRCDSSNTKFCYYNNYSLSQPRHFCESCKRYWTRGGTLRNVPVGGSCRKNKRIKRQNANAIKLSNPDPILSSIANPNAPLNQLPASSSAHLSSLLYGDVNLSSFSPTISPQLINGPNLTFFRDNHYSSFGSPLKQLKVEEYNQPMFPCEDPQQANSEIWQYNYPFEALNAASDSSYLNWTSAMGSVSGWHDAPNSSIAPLF